MKDKIFSPQFIWTDIYKGMLLASLCLSTIC